MYFKSMQLRAIAVLCHIIGGFPLKKSDDLTCTRYVNLCIQVPAFWRDKSVKEVNITTS